MVRGVILNKFTSSCTGQLRVVAIVVIRLSSNLPLGPKMTVSRLVKRINRPATHRYRPRESLEIFTEPGGSGPQVCPLPIHPFILPRLCCRQCSRCVYRLQLVSEAGFPCNGYPGYERLNMLYSPVWQLPTSSQ